MQWKEKIQDVSEEAFEWLNRHWSILAVPILMALFSALLVQSPLRKEIPLYKIGEISKGDFKAPATIELVDEELTFERQRQAEQGILDIYDFDSRKPKDVLLRIESAFEWAQKNVAGGEAVSKTEFEERLEAEVDSSVFDRLKNSNFSPYLENAVKIMAQNFFQNWIYKKEQLVQSDEERRLVVLDIMTLFEEQLSLTEFKEKARSVAQIRTEIEAAQKDDQQGFKPLSNVQFQAVKQITNTLLEPNVSFNQIQTNIKRAEARGASDPAVLTIEKGEMIVREGQRVERRQKIFLDHLRKIQSSQTDLQSSLGFFALILALIYIFHWVGDRNFKKFKIATRDRWVLGAYFIVALSVVTALHLLFDAFHGQEGTKYHLTVLLPFAFVGMTLRLFTSMEITSFFAILFAVCVSWLLKNPFMGLVAMVAAFSGAAAMRHITQRMDVIRAGLLAGAIQGLVLSIGASLGLAISVGLENFWMDAAVCLIFGMFSGLLAAALTLVAQPLIEFVGYTTDLRLMELSNTNHPLLKEMIMKAPGTYYHSFVVSQLSEKAAESINANPLFARVASLYHDVGKTRKAEYFIENIQGDNKHDKLVPSMSALIISNHVKEGIELGFQFKLPQSIVDVIPQHHGTALISYFYNKAKEAAENDEDVNDQDFRYPGPKPQTKEAAIIMMADAVEATAKSMQNATTDTLRQQVNETIRRIFLDGQLDECELSLKDLNAIGNAFVNVLQGIYHQRIEYPHLKNQNNDKAKKEKDPTRSISSSKKAGQA